VFFANDNMARPTKKRKLSSATTANNAPASQASADTPINNARELQNLTSDYTGAGMLPFGGAQPSRLTTVIGLRRFRDFLRTTETDVEDAARNHSLLKEYLEAHCRNVGAQDEEEGETTAFADFAQIWGLASQVRRPIACAF
jgi:hypothetical protein